MKKINQKRCKYGADREEKSKLRFMNIQRD